MSKGEFSRKIKRTPAASIFLSLGVLLILLYWVSLHNTKDQNEKSGEIGGSTMGDGTPMKSVIVKWKTKNKIHGTDNTGSKLDPESVFRDGPVLKLAQNDSRLLEFIREHHVFPPSDKPYNLKDFSTGDPSEHDGKSWQIVYKLLKNKTNGFFIECGANEGEFLSNTLVLERDFGWTGLLIEGDLRMVEKLLAKNRKAWVVDLCLSGKPYPQELQMQRDNNPQGITFVSKKNRTTHEPFTAKSVPIFSILSALDVMFQVDFFLLDIDYFELPVLKTIPFDSVFIKIIVVESLPWNARKVIPFLQSKGYVCLHYIFENHTADYVFIHHSLYEEDMSNITEKGCYIDDAEKFTRWFNPQ